jgi:hypothetical protein
MTRLPRIGRAAFIHIVVLGFVTGLTPAVASAECAPVTISQAMASPRTVAVFSGTVSEIEESAGAIAHVVTFDVQRVWKGTVTQRASLYQLNTTEAIQFSAGVPYLMVAYRLPPEAQEVSGAIRRATTLAVDTCASRTLEHAERRGDLRELGPGRLLR